MFKRIANGIAKAIEKAKGLSPFARKAQAAQGLEEAKKALETGWDGESKGAKRPAILICGYTGAGKTSLLRAIFGKELVGDGLIGHGSPCTKSFERFENERLIVYDSKGLEPGISDTAFLDSLKAFIKSREKDSDGGVSMLWYAIQGPGARVTSCDLALMNGVIPEATIAVITKKDISKPEQLQAIKSSLLSNGAKESRIIEVSESDQESLKALCEASEELLPEKEKEAFISAQLVDLSAKRAKAKKIIHTAAAAAAAVGGANPFPLTDSAILTPLQGALIGSLAYLYGMDKAAAIHVFTPMLAEIAGVSLASSLAKIVPGLGELVNAAVAGALTEAIGWLAQRHFETCAKARIEGKSEPCFEMPGVPVLKELLEQAMKKRRA